VKLFIRWLKSADENRSLDLVLRLTLLEILLRPMGFWGIRAPLLLLSAVGLLLPRILRAPATWGALTLLIGWQLIDAWPLPDNHIYLLCYWCLAIFLALYFGDRGSEMPDVNGLDKNSTASTSPAMKILSANSRFLLGLTFFFAFLWKAFLSPDYIDGRFFRVTLLQDERFAHTAMFFGGLEQSQLLENREYLFPLPQGAELLDPPRLVEPPALKRLAHIFTWGSVLIEAAVAFVMLIPLPGPLRQIRHLLLLGFCVVTFAFAPVAGFGWLILVMGLAQCDRGQKRMRAAYFIAYLLVLLYSEIPWVQLLYNISL
jgi:hypothetical protein